MLNGRVLREEQLDDALSLVAALRQVGAPRTCTASALLFRLFGLAEVGGIGSVSEEDSWYRAVTIFTKFTRADDQPDTNS